MINNLKSGTYFFIDFELPLHKQKLILSQWRVLIFMEKEKYIFELSQFTLKPLFIWTGCDKNSFNNNINIARHKADFYLFFFFIKYLI